MKISIIESKRMRHGIKITSIITRLGKMPRDLLAVEYAYNGGGGGGGEGGENSVEMFSSP